MSRPEMPTKAFAEDFTEMRRTLLALALYIQEKDDDPRDDAAAVLLDSLSAAESRVLGNRSVEVFSSWSDLRLLLANDLRILLDYIDPQ